MYDTVSKNILFLQIPRGGVGGVGTYLLPTFYIIMWHLKAVKTF